MISENKIKTLTNYINSSKLKEADDFLGQISRQPKSEPQFKSLLTICNLTDKNLLGGVFHKHPAFVEGENDYSFRSALYRNLNELDEGSLKSIKSILLDYAKKPDIQTIWKFAFFGHLISSWAGETESEIESGLPTFSRNASKLIGDDWNKSIQLFKLISILYEKNNSQDSQMYTDYLKSLFYCGISASTAHYENISEDGVRTWIWAIGANRNSENRLEDFGISNKGPAGCGEMMQEARRFAEEVLEENFEAPEGVDYEADGYLDDYDWDQLAQIIIDD